MSQSAADWPFDVLYALAQALGDDRRSLLALRRVCLSAYEAVARVADLCVPVRNVGTACATLVRCGVCGGDTRVRHAEFSVGVSRVGTVAFCARRACLHALRRRSIALSLQSIRRNALYVRRRLRERAMPGAWNAAVRREASAFRSRLYLALQIGKRCRSSDDDDGRDVSAADERYVRATAKACATPRLHTSAA